jgi:beta-barrel assembly-enhancing protease
VKRKIAVFLSVLLLAGCATTAKQKVDMCKDEGLKKRAGLLIGIITSCADPEEKYYFAVIESQQVNAYIVSQKNLIVLTSGIMKYYNDKELAFVVAHEVSHKMLGHYGKRVLASGATTTAFRIINIAVPGAGLLNLIVNPAVTNTFSRSQELDADKKASEIIGACLQIPLEDSVSALEKLKDNEKKPWIILFATHPPIEDRIENLKAKKNE